MRSCLLWVSKESSFLRCNLLLWRCYEDCWNDNKEFILHKRHWKISKPASKMLSNSIAFYREIICKRKSQSMQQISLLSYFSEIATATPTFSNHHPVESAAINTEARPSTSKKITVCWKLRQWLAFFGSKVFLIKVCTFLRCNAIGHLIDNSTVNINCIYTGKLKNLCD